MLGATGALTATEPAAFLLRGLGWCSMFDALALATATSAALIYFIVPEAPPESIPDGSKPVTIKSVYTDPRFWRVAPISATCIGMAWALQGLWAALWLSDVERLGPERIVQQLFSMGVALCAGALLFGIVADRLRGRGVRPQALLSAIVPVFIAAQVALISGHRLSPYLLQVVVASMGGATVLSYATLVEYFPQQLDGQANSALNIRHIGGGFVIQYALGYLVALWPSYSGQYPPIAYKAAFAINLAVQAAALTYFLICETSAGPPLLRAAFKPRDDLVGRRHGSSN
jgi:sugar phosphate permease